TSATASRPDPPVASAPVAFASTNPNSGCLRPMADLVGAQCVWCRDPQYSPFITKYEPRIVPASFDFCRANLNEPSSAGTSIPSESLNPTARFFGSSSMYGMLIDSPLS